MLTENEVLLRLLLSCVFGALIGFEREMHSQPAGLRTHVLLCLGSAIAMCLSINISGEYQTEGVRGDPGRMAAQVISGIGFLGAGAIFRYGTGVIGLTTAASLWTTAIIGLATGAGYHNIAGIASLIAIIVLIGLNMFEKKFMRGSAIRSIVIQGQDKPFFIAQIKDLLSEFKISIKSVSFHKDLATNDIKIESIGKVMYDQDLDRLISRFSRIEGVESFKII